MGNASDFIRGGHSITFNNGLHGWAEREKNNLSVKKKERHTYIQMNGKRTS